MTRIFLFFVLCFLLSFGLSAQNKAGTTMEEFLYCTKGFKAQITQGLDPVKKGYVIKKICDAPEESTEFIGMFDEGTNEMRAIIMHYAWTDIFNSTTHYFFCIPNAQTTGEVEEMAEKQFINAVNKGVLIKAQNRLIAHLYENNSQ